MIRFKQKGDFGKVSGYLERMRKGSVKRTLEKYGREGVDALSSATPMDSGHTAESWSYRITDRNGNVAIEFHNTNINEGVPIAIILQYGHGTGTGGWVEGRDYINPAIQPVFDKIAKEVWKEVTRI